MCFSQYIYNKMSEDGLLKSSDESSFTIEQCPTMFEGGYQCGGTKGHGGCCQDMDYDGAQGEHLENPEGKDWSKIQ
jgi:hypothetical protein